MARNSNKNDSSQSAANYVNKKRINELFEVRFSRHKYP
jgi:hypothetical protein